MEAVAIHVVYAALFALHAGFDLAELTLTS
jgi:hypothetical protein